MRGQWHPRSGHGHNRESSGAGDDQYHHRTQRFAANILKSQTRLFRLTLARFTEAPEPSLLLFSAFGSPRFQTITFDKDPECVACSEAARKSAKNKEIDYVQFCGGEVPNWERRGLADGDRQLRITVKVKCLVDIYRALY